MDKVKGFQGCISTVSLELTLLGVWHRKTSENSYQFTLP